MSDDSERLKDVPWKERDELRAENARLIEALEHIVHIAKEVDSRTCVWCTTFHEHMSWCPVRIACAGLRERP